MKKRKTLDIKQIMVTIVIIVVISLGEYLINKYNNENIETPSNENIITNIKIDELPEYSGKIVIDINNNVDISFLSD